MKKLRPLHGCNCARCQKLRAEAKPTPSVSKPAMRRSVIRHYYNSAFGVSVVPRHSGAEHRGIGAHSLMFWPDAGTMMVWSGLDGKTQSTSATGDCPYEFFAFTPGGAK